MRCYHTGMTLAAIQASYRLLNVIKPKLHNVSLGNDKHAHMTLMTLVMYYRMKPSMSLVTLMTLRTGFSLHTRTHTLRGSGLKRSVICRNRHGGTS